MMRGFEPLEPAISELTGESGPIQVAELKVPSSIQYLRRIREAVSTSIPPRIPEGLIKKIVLAVDEAVSNIVLHQAGPEVNGMIDVRIEAHPGRVEVKLRNKGPYFDPTTHPMPDVEAHMRQGTRPSLGIFLMKKILDDMKYCHDAGMNELILTKNLTESN